MHCLVEAVSEIMFTVSNNFVLTGNTQRNLKMLHPSSECVYLKNNISKTIINQS